jgi:hypothetical protein
MGSKKSFTNSISIPLFIRISHSFLVFFHLIRGNKNHKITIIQHVKPSRIALCRTRDAQPKGRIHHHHVVLYQIASVSIRLPGKCSGLLAQTRSVRFTITNLAAARVTAKEEFGNGP